MYRVRGSNVKTFAAEAGASRVIRDPGTREWVFPLLSKPTVRARIDRLAGLELRRRPDCEPTLRSLATD